MIYYPWQFLVSLMKTFFRRTSRLSVAIFMTKTGNQKLKLNWWKLFSKDEQVECGYIYDENWKPKIETQLMKTFFEGQAGNEESLAHLVRPRPPEGREEKVLTMNLHFQSHTLQHSIDADGDPRSPQTGPCHYFVTLPTPSSPDHLVAMVGNIANSLRGKEI